MVVAAHPLAADAGREILAEGGTAVDAAVAVSLAIGVVEPFASGLGGGGYMLVAPGGDEAGTVAVDFRGVTPSIQTEEHFYPKGATLPWTPKIGPSSATIPGIGRALDLALKKWGSRPVDRLARRAIELAEKGFDVSDVFAYVSGLFEGTLRSFPDAARIFLKEGRRYRAGERLVQADLARTLKRVASAGFEDLFTGEVGRAMTAAANATGPVWGETDLSKYEVKVRAPLLGEIAGARIATMGPPSRGGAGILAALGRFEKRGLPQLGHNTERTIPFLAETFRDLFHKLEPVIGDPDVFEVDLKSLELSRGAAPTGGSPSTTHFTIVDRAGTVVSMSQTIGHFFGSGVVVPGWGILLNDDISDMDRRLRANSHRPIRQSGGEQQLDDHVFSGQPWLHAAQGTNSPASFRDAGWSARQRASLQVRPREVGRGGAPPLGGRDAVARGRHRRRDPAQGAGGVDRPGRRAAAARSLLRRRPRGFDRTRRNHHRRGGPASRWSRPRPVGESRGRRGRGLRVRRGG